MWRQGFSNTKHAKQQMTINRIEKLKEMLNFSPKDNFLRHALALEYIKAGNDADARPLFEAVLNECPEYVGSYYHLGKLLERNNEPELAIKWYEQGMAEAKKADERHAYNELQSAYEDLVY